MTNSKIQQLPRPVPELKRCIGRQVEYGGTDESERGRPGRQDTSSRYLRVAAGRVFLVHRWEQVSGKLTGKGVDLIR